MYSLEDLLHLMSRLRDPKYGCPWDIKQTYATIVPHTLEEAYEVADAIERGDFDHLLGELGDLLFQVVYYSQLAREEGRFEFAGVIDSITRKLIRRHPHVFPTGDLYAPLDIPQLSEEQVKERWEQIKAEERAEKSDAPEQLSLLDDVPTALPSLSRAAKLQKRVGATMQILVDSAPALGRKGGTGRSYADAPEIDGLVRLLPPEKISKTLKVGEFTKARIVAAEGHDLLAVPF